MTIDLTGRRIALVGGAGFIGHNMALTFRDLGAEVEVVDGLEVNHLVTFTGNLELPNRDFYVALLNERLRLLSEAGVPLRIQDARDYHMLSHVLKQFEPDTIVHLAAVAHAGWANKNPYSTFDHSLRTLENSLDYARGNGVQHFVYFSSSMAYGNFPEGLVTEETACSPLGIYGALKLSGEHMVVAYEQVFQLPFTIIRPSALYGERCVSRRVGQVFIERAMRGLPLTVSGTGEERLDFTYIADLVDGTARAIATADARNEVFNLTYGRGRAIRELIEILQTEFPDVQVEHTLADALMPERGTLSIDKARRILGYEPQYPIEDGYRRYIAWYKKLQDERPELFVER